MTVAEFKTQIPVEPQIAFPHVLIATDFSEASQRALCSALTLAGGTAAEFSIIHVLQPDWRYATLENPPEIDRQRVDAEPQLKSLQDVPHRDIHIVLLRNPHVAEAVASVINESDVDLLVLGTRGRGGLSKLALGSVAEELLRLAPCPVMTFGPKADVASSLHGPGFHSILFATDCGPGSIAALPLTLAPLKSGLDDLF
jgi:universal stress protein A